MENSPANSEDMNKIVKSTSTKQVNDQKVEFLKDALTYLEGRINLIDSKASIFMAIHSGLFALVTFVTKEVFWTPAPSTVNSVSYVILAIDFFLLISTLLLLVKTVRPSKFFGLRVPLDQVKAENYVMWPQDGFPESAEDYKTKIESLDPSKIQANYEKAHYVALQLVRMKYKYYRWAIIGLKVMILWSAIGLGLLALLNIVV